MLKQITIEGVRNLAHTHVTLPAGATALFGANGSGKTSFLEAIHLLAVGRSFRTHQSKPVIQHSMTHCRVVGEVQRGGRRCQVEPEDICVGDVVFLASGDRLCADIRTVETTNLKIEQSSLTGEPDAIKKEPLKNHENPLESKNLCFYGTSCTEGKGTGIVVMIGDDTIMGKIAGMASDGAKAQTPINREIERFIHIVSAVAIVLGVTFCIIGLIMDPSWPGGITSNLVFMIGIIVANVPEGLLATVTVCLTLTAKRMFNKKVLDKNLEGGEKLRVTTFPLRMFQCY